MSDKQKMIERLQKLLRMADGQANENESQTALVLAHKLMKEHGMQMADLKEATGVDWDIEKWTSEWKSQIDSYSRILACATAKLFDCEWWMLRPGRRYGYKVSLCFTGEKVDLAMAIEVWPWLGKESMRFARTGYGSGWSPSHRCFAESFACRVLERASEMSEKDRKSNGDEDDQKYALVVRDKENAIQEFLENDGVKLKMRNSSLKGGYDHNAATAGTEAGGRVNLNFRKGVSNGGSAPQIST